MVIVVVYPLLVCRRAGVIGQVGVGVGPFGGQRAVEAFTHFSVGLGSVRSRPFVVDRRPERERERPCPVTVPVVSQDAFHGDTVVNEERVGALPERRRGLLGLIGEDL
jgi:hypothetical protein